MLTYVLLMVSGISVGVALAMVPMLKKMVNDSLTGVDNATFDIAREGFAASLATFLGLVIYQVVFKNKDFDMQAFAIAVGAMVAALGAALNLKSKTEPGQEDKNAKS